MEEVRGISGSFENHRVDRSYLHLRTAEVRVAGFGAVRVDGNERIDRPFEYWDLFGYLPRYLRLVSGRRLLSTPGATGKCMRDRVREERFLQLSVSRSVAERGRSSSFQAALEADYERTDRVIGRAWIPDRERMWRAPIEVERMCALDRVRIVESAVGS